VQTGGVGAVLRTAPAAELFRFALSGEVAAEPAFVEAVEVKSKWCSMARLAGFPPDALIAVPKDACRTQHFQPAAPTVELGRELTAQALEAFEVPTDSNRQFAQLDLCQLGGRCA
jgi:hypothetical protein